MRIRENPMKYLLGIDVGTTGTKTLLFSEKGELLGQAYQGYETATPHNGWNEQNGLDWWNAIRDTIRQVCVSEEIRRSVAAISLSLQGGTMIPVDAEGNQVRPAIVWNDSRCTEEHEQFLREVGEASYMYEKTGWKLGKCLLPLDIRWMKNNEPENFAKTAMFLSVPDYVALKMTGIPAIDMSDAGINETADIRAEKYDEKLLAFAGITEKQLPKLVHSGEVIGHLTEAAAEELGLTTDCVLVAGAHDQYAVALGAGANQAGDILIGSGTCWVVTAIGDEPDFSRGLSQSIAAVPGKWGSLLSLSSGGVCLDWFRKRIANNEDGSTISYDAVNKEVAARKAAEEGLFFVPFSKLGKASFLGLDLSHDRFHMMRAVMEGVAFQVIWMMESFKTKPGKEGLKLTGGASKSKLWAQMVANIANLPVRIPAVADMACVGAAILAGVGAGIFEDAKAGYARLAVPDTVLQPQPEEAEKYAKLYAEYKEKVSALAPLFKD